MNDWSDKRRKGERFVGKPIQPAGGSVEGGAMVVGDPVLPGRFRLGDREIVLTGVLEKWKTTTPCNSGANEQYVRKHWFRVATTDGEEMRIYCDRQLRPGGSRWWLFTTRPMEAESNE